MTRTVMTITFPGKGVPGTVLGGIETALYAYYSHSPMVRWGAKAWSIGIEVIEEAEPADEDVD